MNTTRVAGHRRSTSSASARPFIAPGITTSVSSRSKGTDVASKEATAAAPSAAPARRKLSYKEQQELAALPSLLERLEAEIAGLHAEMATEGYYRRSADALAADRTRLEEAQRRLADGYARWELLEGSG